MVPLTRLFMNTQTKIHNENWKWSHEAKYGTCPSVKSHSNTNTHTHTHTHNSQNTGKSGKLQHYPASLERSENHPNHPKEWRNSSTSLSCSWGIQHIDQSFFIFICSFIHQSYAAMVRKIHLFPVRTLFRSWKGTFEMEPGWCHSRTRVIGWRDSAGAFWLALDLLILVTPSSPVWTRHPLVVYTLTSNRLWAKLQITLTVCNSPKRMHYMIHDKGWQMLWP